MNLSTLLEKNHLKVTLANGRVISIIAGDCCYSAPREGSGPFSEVEVGSWGGIIKGLEHYAEPTDDPSGLVVYGYVPVDMVILALAEEIMASERGK